MPRLRSFYVAVPKRNLSIDIDDRDSFPVSNSQRNLMESKAIRVCALNVRSMMGRLDRVDYSVAVRLNAKPANSWRWEINCAGRSSPTKGLLCEDATASVTAPAGNFARIADRATHLVHYAALSTQQPLQARDCLNTNRNQTKQSVPFHRCARHYRTQAVALRALLQF